MKEHANVKQFIGFKVIIFYLFPATPAAGDIHLLKYIFFVCEPLAVRSL
jgi:hypothetical protein